MRLVLDIGNSQTSYGIFDKGALLHHWRSETKVSRTADEYAAFLFPLLSRAQISESSIEGIAICSVVPPVEQNFEIFCQTYLNRASYKVNTGGKLNFTLNVDFPGEVGADRLANAAYAVKHLKLPAIVVDMGTATTFDVISAGKVYEGGIILPGVRMASESLGAKTSLLPVTEVRFPDSVIGKNTVTCIQSGVLFGYCDTIDGLFARLEKELNARCTLVLTGGLAPLIHPKLQHSSQLLPNLTLEGIEILYRENSGK